MNTQTTNTTRSRKTTQPAKAKDLQIGTITTYHGDEFPWMVGHKIKVIAVFKGSLAPNRDYDEELPYIRDNDYLAQLGGITAHDRVEVQPWIEKEGRFSFASSDPRAIDLAGFKKGAR